MKPGTRVITQYGKGTVVRPEGSEGVLADRYLVQLDELRSSTLREMQIAKGGLYFHKLDLKKAS